MPSTLTLEMMRIDNKDYYHETSHFSDYCRPFNATRSGASRLSVWRSAGCTRKNTVLNDLRKICTPQGSPSDEIWEKTIMADTRNQQHIREAILAIQRNNQNNYWEALGKVECPDL